MDRLDLLLDLAVEGLMPPKPVQERVKANITEIPPSPIKAARLVQKEQSRIFQDCFARFSALLQQGTVLLT